MDSMQPAGGVNPRKTEKKKLHPERTKKVLSVFPDI